MSHTYPSKVTPVAHALISKCQLINRETSEQAVAEYRDCLLTLQEEEYIKCGHPEGSPWQVWFREVAQSTPTPSASSDPNAVSGLSVYDFHDPQTRNIVLKKGAEFTPDNIFFRTVDTGRALPMKLADFRIQWYAHKNHWDHVDRMKKQKKEVNWEMCAFAIILHQLLVLRNMHDQMGSDIPVIIVDWNDRTIGLAMDYWVNLSKGIWTDRLEERDVAFQHVFEEARQNGFPCFYQADLLVRSLLHDKAVGYVPPFIVLQQRDTAYGKSRILFTSPLHTPPHSFLASFPIGCNGPHCTDPKCASFLFHLPSSDPLSTHAYATLAPNTPMVRDLTKAEDYLGRRIVCNLWGCERGYLLGGGVDGKGEIGKAKWTKGEGAKGGMEWRVIFGGNAALGPDNGKLLRCQRCREVVYCCKEHQATDWNAHKKICEKRN